MMKQIVLLLAAVALFLTASAQTQSSLNNIASEVNKECPKNISDGLTLISVSVDAPAKQVIYNYKVDGSKIDFPALKAQKDLLQDVKATELTTAPDATTQELVTICRTNGISIVYQMICGADSMDLIIKPTDL